ncbi:MAG: acyl-CoA synthetase FdrA [Elusimicrobia bacterium]|nr:acyl-CoA synthetase FdrA [Elusimicrobiota bacterium]
MVIKGTLSKGKYYDSVTLMAVARKLSACEGVLDAAAVMGTDSNKAILKASGLLSGRFAASSDADLLIAVKASTEALASTAMARAEELLKAGKKKDAGGKGVRPRSLEAALESLPGANMAVISVAGKYAADEAMACLRRGLHVMIFSDNVPLEREVELKRFGAARGLMVMGPDCGTAIINGAPLAFANVVRRGDIGVVSAAGTGLQEVACAVSNAGAGISQALGTGGRDVKKDVGGIMFLQGLKALLQDSRTKVVLLVSKPPHPDVVAKIGRALRGAGKPVVAVFMGAEPELVASLGAFPAVTLEEAALLAAGLSLGEKPGAVLGGLLRRQDELAKTAERLAAGFAKGQRYCRGLFCGGTFCAEAQVVFRRYASRARSNAPVAPFLDLRDSWKSVGHSFVDLGADEFTQGRPHPMIDYSVRNRRILQEAADPEVAVLQLDVVLGHGSNPTPASDLAPAIRDGVALAKKAGRHLAVVATVTGTDLDPQNKAGVEAALRKAGVLLQPSNASASVLAGEIVRRLGR